MSDWVLALLWLFGAPVVMGVLFWLMAGLDGSASNGSDDLPLDSSPW